MDKMSSMPKIILSSQDTSQGEETPNASSNESSFDCKDFNFNDIIPPRRNDTLNLDKYIKDLNINSGTTNPNN